MTDAQTAIERLDTYGYCVLEERMPAAQAAELSQRLLEQHADPAPGVHLQVQDRYQTLYGLFNR